MACAIVRPCPHCKQEVGITGHYRHVLVCPLNPEMYDAIRDAMQSTEFPGFAVPTRDYHAIARERRLAGVDVLQRMFGSWLQAAAYFGLRASNSKDLEDLRAIREVARAHAEAKRIRQQSWGLTVYDPHPARGGGIGYWVR